MCRMVDHLFGAVVRQGHPAQLKRWDVGGVSRVDHLFGAVGGGHYSDLPKPLEKLSLDRFLNPRSRLGLCLPPCLPPLHLLLDPDKLRPAAQSLPSAIGNIRCYPVATGG